MGARLVLSDQDRARGALLGLAVGDALGARVEFKRPGSFEPVQDMLGGGVFDLAPGEWTDDTSMALCLAESLLEREGFDPHDQLSRYLRWFREGHFSVKGYCFDIGTTTRHALNVFESTGQPYCGPTGNETAGNGCIMRLSPLAVAYDHDPALAIRLSGMSSRTTHGARICIDACRYMGAMLVGALQGRNKDELLSPAFSPVDGLWDEEPLVSQIARIAEGSFRERQPPDIRGTGYVADTLEAALWAFAHHDDFDEGVLAAVNLGDDADTTGAVYGQIAGAYYGASDIRSDWLEKLAMRELIDEMATRLAALRPVTNLA